MFIVSVPSHSLDLQHQIEELMSRLRQSQVNMANMQTDYDDRLQKANYELLKLREEFVKLRDRYERQGVCYFKKKLVVCTS